MKHKINVFGTIIPNNYKRFYDFAKMDSTCPADIEETLLKANDGDDVEIYINSGGGEISSGSSIYTSIREHAERLNIKIKIIGQACSAASIIAMAAYSEMSPTALMMVHCVSVGGYGGNHTDFEHMAEELRTADEALCNAYVEKTGMTKEEALAMMEHETWMTAKQAKEKGLIDAIMFEKTAENSTLSDIVNREDALLVASTNFINLPSLEDIEDLKEYIESKTVKSEENLESKPLNIKLDESLVAELTYLSLKVPKN